MDPELFKKSTSGRLVPTVGGGQAFVPNPLPPELELGSLLDLVAEASEGLGELRGLGRQLTNPYLLARPLQHREAVSSSNIEGTYTSLTDLALLEAGADGAARPTDTREVLNYVQALDTGIERLSELPVCSRLICEMHGELLKDLPPHRRTGGEPGHFKLEQNWIGGSQRDITKARFVPPPPRESMQAMSDLEKFINDDTRKKIQPLIFLALVHYQFEAIHPFPDGNGRVGRILIPLILHAKGILPQPLLYMSQYFEDRKDEYVDLMYNVSKTGSWLPWIIFFLEGVISSTQLATETISALLDLSESYRRRLQEVRSSASILTLVDSLFERPAISIPMAQKKLGVTYKSAKRNIEKLVAENILIELPEKYRSKYFLAQGIIDTLNKRL
jgi:Fic family protein